MLNGKTISFLILATLMLASCNGPAATPPPIPTDVTETATLIIETEIPAATFTTTPLPSPLPPTETSTPSSDQIVYYYFFVPIAEDAPPEGSVEVMANELILAPTSSETTRGPDTAADLRMALEAVLNDERNYWRSGDLKIITVAFSEGRVDVVLEGEYFGVAPIVLTAARMQILLTLFANTSVQTATVTLNGDTIANIDVSREGKPADYVYTRREIETYMAEHASAAH